MRKPMKIKTVTGIDNFTLNTSSGTGEYLMNEFTTKYSAYGLDLVGYIPVSAYFDFVGSVGVAKYDFETSANFAVYDVTGTRLVDGITKSLTTAMSAGVRQSALRLILPKAWLCAVCIGMFPSEETLLTI